MSGLNNRLCQLLSVGGNSGTYKQCKFDGIITYLAPQIINRHGS